MKKKVYIIILILLILIIGIFIIFKLNINNIKNVKLYYLKNDNYVIYNLNEAEKSKIKEFIKQEKFEKLKDMYKCLSINEYKIVFDGNELYFDGENFCVATLKEKDKKNRQVIINDDLRNYINEIVKKKGN